MITGKQLAEGKAKMAAVVLRIAEDVLKERERQNLKFRGNILTSGHHNALTYACILGEESGESTQAALDLIFEKDPNTNMAANLAHLREELVQTAAVAFAFIERIDVLDAYLIHPEGAYERAQQPNS